MADKFSNMADYPQPSVTTPVSYTHLDVYKRQMHGHLLKVELVILKEFF